MFCKTFCPFLWGGEGENEHRSTIFGHFASKEEGEKKKGGRKKRVITENLTVGWETGRGKGGADAVCFNDLRWPRGKGGKKEKRVKESELERNHGQAGGKREKNKTRNYAGIFPLALTGKVERETTRRELVHVFVRGKGKKGGK